MKYGSLLNFMLTKFSRSITIKYCQDRKLDNMKCLITRNIRFRFRTFQNLNGIVKFFSILLTTNPSLQEHVQRIPVYHTTPNVSRPGSQLSEDEQIKIAKRLGLISHLPTGIYDGTSKRGKE